MKIDYIKLGDLTGSIAETIAESQGASSGLAALIGHGIALIPRLVEGAVNGDLDAKAQLRDILGPESASSIERAIDDEARLARFGPDE